MKIHIGADHNGFAFKKQLTLYLNKLNYEVEDDGAIVLSPDDDFPDFAAKVVWRMRAETDFEKSRGILICGSGQGMCMAANRFKGIRASLCWNIKEARSARNDDDSNILCLPADGLVRFSELEPIILTWLKTPYAAAPRFKRRLSKLDSLDDNRV